MAAAAPDSAVPVTTRDRAEALDHADPLAPFRERFVTDVDPGVATDTVSNIGQRRVYLDANSLGPLSLAAARTLTHTVEVEWGQGLVGSWDRWITLAAEIGDRLASGFLGASPGEVIVADSTTVNLYKLVWAALDAEPAAALLTDRDNFPTDRYVLEGIAAARGAPLTWIDADAVQGPTEDDVATAIDRHGRPAVIVLSHVSYRSGALADMASITEIARRRDARVVWDLSHSVGAVPIDLASAGVDLAVGCTYKHLKGGPGAPAFLYVAQALQDRLRQPIWGWFGQEDQFEMGPSYAPASGMGRWLSGTPPVLSLATLGTAIDVVAEAGIDAIRAKSSRLGDLVIELADPSRTGGDDLRRVRLASPEDRTRRGAHVSLRHPRSWQLCQALRDRYHVVTDFRPPDIVRLGPDALTTRYVDVWDAMERFGHALETRAWADYPVARTRVT